MWRWRATRSPVDALALGDARCAFIIGGGGKTTLLAALTRELTAHGRVIATTSTQILRAEGEHIGELVVEERLPRLVVRLAERAADAWPVVVARGHSADGRKLVGWGAEELDALYDAGVADRLLVEADGSAGRSLKAHAAHEPVVSRRAEIVIAVVGVDCLGEEIDDEHVHRADLLRGLLGRALGDRVSVDDVIEILLHPEGYLRAVPAGARVAVLISKARDEARRGRGRALGQQLVAADRARRIAAIAVGDLTDGGALQTLQRRPHRPRSPHRG